MRAYITILKYRNHRHPANRHPHHQPVGRGYDQQAIQDKTISDAMDQLMWIRQDIDELKNTEAETADLSEFI